MSAGLAWLTWSLQKDVTSLLGTASTFERRFVNIGIKLGELTKASPVNLAAEVAALSVAVAKLADTQRKFAGRMDRRYQLDKGRDDDAPADDAGVTDAKWLALRAAQDANPRGPQ